MDSSILTEKTAGLPNIVWAGVAVAGYFILSRALGSTPAASGTTDTGSGGIPGSGGPAGVGPCPIISPVQCGSGFTSQAGIDANGCPILQCVPIGSGGTGTGTQNHSVVVRQPGAVPGYDPYNPGPPIRPLPSQASGILRFVPWGSTLAVYAPINGGAEWSGNSWYPVVGGGYLAAGDAASYT